MPDRLAIATEVVRLRLEIDDPQLPAPDVRAARIVSDLYEMGLLAVGPRVETVAVSEAVL